MATSSLGDAGANHLGYYTATFSPTGTGLVAHGYTGALHLWKKRQDHAAAADNHDDDDDDDLPWVPQPAPGGHFGPVVSLCWAADNHCVLSVSTDQTARMLTQMKKRWCEIARPQVHGHDFYGVAALQNLRSQGKELTEGYFFASASEEKVIRVFQAPRAFEESLALATGLPLAVHTSSKSIQGSTNGHHNNNQNQNQATALGASLPALGLSNKAVYNELTAEQQKSNNGDFESYQGPDFAPFSTPGVVSEPPVEEHLAQSTLWPEIHKLYGHGNEVFCLSGDPLGRWIASASKAQSVATAGIRLWDTDTWSVAPGKPLEAHTLTVTQLAFSPNGKYLASCSRDRSVAVFVRTKEHVEVSDNNGASYSSTTAAPFTLGWKGSKAHSRIVWSVHWSPDSLFLASSSRDGVIKIWSAASVGEGVGVEMKEVGSVSLGDSVRSVAFAPRNNNSSSSGSSYSLAVGLEGGDIKLFTVGIIRDGDSSGCVLEEVWQTSVETKHAAAVRMLAWRSRGEEDDGAEMLLASSGDDHAVRIYRF
jgi:elongator complex protein 2